MKRSRADLDGARALEDLDRGTHRRLDLDHLRGGLVAGVEVLDVADQRQAEDAAAAVELLAHRHQVEPQVVGRAEPVTFEVGQGLQVPRQGLRGLAQHDAAVGQPPREVAALAVGRSAPHGLDRERQAVGLEPAGDLRVGHRAEVVGVGDEHPLVALLDQPLEQAGAAQRGVEVAVTRRAPLEVGVLRVRRRAEVRLRGAWAPCSARTPAAGPRRGGRRSARRRPSCRRRCGTSSSGSAAGGRRTPCGGAAPGARSRRGTTARGARTAATWRGPCPSRCRGRR